MGSASYVGRVGGLAVALGVGAAVLTGTGVAWADDDPGSSASDSAPSDSGPSDSGPSGSGPSGSAPSVSAQSSHEAPSSSVSGTPKEEAPEDGTPKDGTPKEEAPKEEAPKEEAPKEEVPESLSSDPPTESKKTVKAAVEPADEQTPTSSVSATEVKIDADRSDPMRQPEAKLTAPAATRTASIQVQAVTPQPTVPSLRPWPTAFDPVTAVSYLTGIVSSVVDAVLSPFAAGLPGLPSDPSAWALLAWVRRELFNTAPTIAYDPVNNSQGLDDDGDVVIVGSLGADDPDGDRRTYTVVGRPLNGGVVDVAPDGTFTYRPMNAMAAVGGTDSFTVVVSDETAGLHVHGPLGLLQFVPILGNFLNPGGGHAVARRIDVTVTPVDGVDLSFPDDFHWGVAHAGFQAEGGPGSPVDPNSDWYRWVHDPINQLLKLTNGVPEDGPGTYVSYDSDADLARNDLGMNTFRMGIEWSRIFPNSTASVDVSDGVVTLADLEALDLLANQDEVAHYRAVFASLRAHGLEPLVTVNHFTLPTWINDPTTSRPLIQLGLPAPAAGWLSPTTPIEFEKYAAYVAWKYGDQVDDWATINEPFSPVLTEYFAIPGVVPAWPPGVIRPDLASTFLVNQAKGHVAAYDAIHLWDNTAATAGQPAAFVGFTNNMIPARPADPVNPLDVQAANAWNQFYNQWFPNAVIDGWVDVDFDGVETSDEVFADFTDKVDWLGVQYYGSQPMQGFGVAPVPGFPFLAGLPIRCAAESPTCSDFNQPTDPGGFREVLDVAASYGKPLWVTENGIADAGDSKRPPYIVNHVAVVQDQIAHGMDIRGYTYWSFVDNLEWASGYDLQFGLYGSDPTTPELERTPKPASISAVHQITTANALPLGLLATYVP